MQTHIAQLSFYLLALGAMMPSSGAGMSVESVWSRGAPSSELSPFSSSSSSASSANSEKIGGAPGSESSKTALVPVAVHSGISLFQIMVLCVCMYSAIGALWIIHLRHTRSSGESTGNYYIGLLCISWVSMSVGMHVMNKSLATKLQAPALITAIQMVIAVVLIGGTNYRRLIDADRKQLFVWLLVPGLFSAMLVSSIYTFEYISLSLLTVIRNLTPMVILPIETMVMPQDKRPLISPIIIVSMLVMLVGALLYGGGLDHVSTVGLIFAVANMFLASADRLVQRRLLTTECKDLHSSVCTTMNNFFGMLPTLVVALCTHQVSEVMVPAHRVVWSDAATWFLLVLSGCVGIGICWLGFECQRHISATSFFVMTNASKVAVVAAGVAFFQDPLKSATGTLGLVLSLCGSFIYGKSQLDLQAAAKQAIADAAATNRDCLEAEGAAFPKTGPAAQAILAKGDRKRRNSNDKSIV